MGYSPFDLAGRMSDPNGPNFSNQVGTGGGGGGNSRISGGSWGHELGRQSARAGRFATLGERGFGQLGHEAAADRDYLRKIRSGEMSVSAEQLRQAQQMNQSQQMSMAANANPANAAMAARTAQNNAAMTGAGLAGQQALAGIAERNAAAQQLTGATLGARGQDLQAALGARGQQLGALQGGFGIQTQYDIAKMQQPEDWEKYLGAGIGLGQAFLMRPPGK